jgi:hypothetical protein
MEMGQKGRDRARASKTANDVEGRFGKKVRLGESPRPARESHALPRHGNFGWQPKRTREAPIRLSLPPSSDFGVAGRAGSALPSHLGFRHVIPFLLRLGYGATGETLNSESFREQVVKAERTAAEWFISFGH